MSTLEDQVRAATRARAQEITRASIPPPRFSPRGRPGTRRRTRLVIPLAAAAAVLAVVSGVVLAVSQPPRATIAASGQRSGRIPRYYVALSSQRTRSGQPPGASVYASATGAKLITISPPRPYRGFSGVTAAADDRTFVLTAQAPASTLHDAAGLFLLRFSPVTHTAALTALPQPRIPASDAIFGLALAPDARKLAVLVEPGRQSSPYSYQLRVADIATSWLRTWSSRPGDGHPEALSWTGDSRTLAFDWAQSAHPGLRLLNTAASGTHLLSSSRLVLPFGGQAASASRAFGAPIITPDGRTAIAAVGEFSRSDRERSRSGYAEFSVATGAIRRILDFRRGWPRTGLMAPGVLWSNATGSVLIVDSPPGQPNRIGVLRGNRLTLLPRPAGAEVWSAAW
jgi:hypothetical protein